MKGSLISRQTEWEGEFPGTCDLLYQKSKQCRQMKKQPCSGLLERSPNCQNNNGQFVNIPKQMLALKYPFQRIYLRVVT